MTKSLGVSFRDSSDGRKSMESSPAKRQQLKQTKAKTNWPLDIPRGSLSSEMLKMVPNVKEPAKTATVLIGITSEK